MPVIAVGLFIGSLSVSKAQSVLFTNVDSIVTGFATTTVPAPGASIVRPYGTGDSYFINSAGTTDNSLKDGGQGVGADIRMSVSGNGIRLISNQKAFLNSSSDVYTFYNTITDQTSGTSGVLFTTFVLNTTFNEGTSLTSATLLSFGSLQGGALSGNALTLGNSIYTASNFSFTPPSAPPNGGGASSTDGAFSEHITAFPRINVPEPGTVAMFIGMGVGGTTLLFRRKRK